MAIYNLYEWVNTKQDGVIREHWVGVSLKKCLNMSGNLREK